jgi:hypothetical protein
MKTLRVYIDTEFTDFTNTDIISLGACAENGMEFYGENSDFIRSYSSPWVESNIYPMLDFSKFGMKRVELSARFWTWIEELPCANVIISYDYETDWKLVNDLFNCEPHPKIIKTENLYHRIFEACDQHVIALGGTNDQYHKMVEKVRKEFQGSLDTYFSNPNIRRHHALDDAIGNKLAFTQISNEHGI